MSVYNTLHFVLSHPLNRGRRIASLSRVLRWQVGSRLLRGAVAVPFVNQVQLLVEVHAVEAVDELAGPAFVVPVNDLGNAYVRGVGESLAYGDLAIAARLGI